MNVQLKDKTQRRKVVPIRPKWWHSHFWRMVIHIFQAATLFVLIGAVAFGLNHYVDYLQAHHASGFLVHVLKLAEDGLVVIDIVVLLVNIIRGYLNEWFGD